MQSTTTLLFDYCFPSFIYNIHAKYNRCLLPSDLAELFICDSSRDTAIEIHFPPHYQYILRITSGEKWLYSPQIRNYLIFPSNNRGNVPGWWISGSCGNLESVPATSTIVDYIIRLIVFCFRVFTSLQIQQLYFSEFNGVGFTL